MLMESGEILATVHDAMARATEKKKLVTPVGTSVRMAEETQAKLYEICKAHGTSASAFLRECAEGLVRDYEGRPNGEVEHQL